MPQINIFEAVRSGNIDLFDELSKQPGFDPNLRDDDGGTLLMWAAYYKQVAIVDKLLDAGADVTIVDKNNSTVACFAAKSGDLDVIKLLAEKNTSIFSLNNNLESPLHLAVANGHADAAKFLVEEMRVLIDSVNEKGQSPLHIAIERENEAIVTTLLKNGADVNFPDRDNVRPIHCAVRTENLPIITLIANQPGIQMDALNNFGELPITYPLQKKLIPILDLLFKKGADMEIRDKYGMTAMHNALTNDMKILVNYFAAKDSKIDTEEFLIQRQLANVFNNDSLIKLLNVHGGVNFGGGGSVIEAVLTLKSTLVKFLEENKIDKTEFQPLLDAVEKFAQDWQFNQKPNYDLSPKHPNLMVTGCFDHGAYVISKKKEGSSDLRLIFAERGLFYKNSSIFSADIPAQHVQEVIDKLKQASTANETAAYDILYKEIPNLIPKKQYTFWSGIQQKPFKNGHCYFENLKSAFLAEFIEIFGDSNAGKEFYKQFDLFMHEQALQDYKDYYEQHRASQPHGPELIANCEAIIAEKEDKLTNAPVKKKRKTL